MLKKTFSLLGLRTAPAPEPTPVQSRRTKTQKYTTSLYLISLSVCLSPRPNGIWVVASSVLGLALRPEQLPGQLGCYGESVCQQALGLGYALIISPWVWKDVNFLSNEPIFFLILCGLVLGPFPLQSLFWVFQGSVPSSYMAFSQDFPRTDSSLSCHYFDSHWAYPKVLLCHLGSTSNELTLYLTAYAILTSTTHVPCKGISLYRFSFHPVIWTNRPAVPREDWKTGPFSLLSGEGKR